MTNSSLELGEVTQPGKPKSKKWIIIATLLVVIIGGATAFGFYIQNSPKELYLLSEYNTYQDAAKEWEDSYGNQLKFQEALLEKPSSTEVKLSGNFETEIENPEFAMIQEILKQAAIVIKTDQDPIAKSSNSHIALEMAGTKAIEMDFLQTKERFLLNAPTLYDQPFYLNLDQYGEFMRRMDPAYEGPEKLEVVDLKWADIKLSDEELEHIRKQYGLFVLGKLKDEQFSLQKGVSYEHNGTSLKLRELTLSLSPEEANEILAGVIDQMIADDKLQTMIADRVAKLVNAAAANQPLDPEMASFADSAQVKAKIKEGLESIKKELPNTKFAQGFKSTILINDDERIVDRKVTFDLADEQGEEVGFLFSSQNVILDKQRDVATSLEISPKDESGDKIVFQMTNKITSEESKRTEDASYKFFLEQAGSKEFDFDLSLTSIFTGEQGGKENVDRTFKLQLVENESGFPIPAIQGKIKETKDLNMKENSYGYVVDLELEAEGFPAKVFLTFDTKSVVKDKIELPTIDVSQGVNVAEISDEELFGVMMEIQGRLATVVQELGLGF